MNEKYESTAQVQDTPVASLAPSWEELKQTTDHMASIFNQHQEKEDLLAIQANKYAVATQVMDLTTKAKEEADKELNPVDATKTYKAVVQGGTEAISQHVFARNESYAKEILTYKVDEAKQDFANATAVRAKQDAYASFSNAHDTFNNEMANAANRGDKVAAATLYGQSKQLIDKAVGSGALDPARGAIFQKQTQKLFHTNIVLGQYRNAIAAGDPAKFKKDFMASKSYDAYLSPQDKQSIVAQFHKMDITSAAVDGVNSATNDEFSKQAIYDGAHGIAIDHKMLADLAITEPKKFPNILEKIRVAQGTYLITSTYDDASVPKIQTAIADLKDPNKVAKTYQEQTMKLNAAKILETKLKTLKDDPASIAVVSPAYQAVVKKQKAAGKLDPLGTRIAYQKHLGVDNNHIAALTNEEAFNEVSSFKRYIKPQDQVNVYLKYIQGIKPANQPYVTRDLQKAGFPLASQYLLRVAHDKDMARYSVDASTAWSHIQEVNGVENYTKGLDSYSKMLGYKDGTTITKLSNAIDLDKNFQKYANVIIASGNPTKRFSDYKGHFELLTLQLMSKGKSQDDAISTASDIMNAGTEIDSFRGSSYIYDKSLDSSLVSNACKISISNHLNSEDVAIPLAVQKDLPGVNHKDMLDYFLGTATFINTPDQSGLMMVYPDSTGGYNPVLDKSNKRISFTFKDLKDGTSTVSKQALHAQSILDNGTKQSIYQQYITEHPNLTKSQLENVRYSSQIGTLL